MTKIRYFIWAIIALMSSASAFAKLPTRALFSPNEENIATNQKITVSFDNETQDVDDILYIMVYSIGGIGFNQDPIYTPYIVTDGELTFSLDKENWGYPYDGEYKVNIRLIVCNEDFTPIESSDGDMIVFQKDYKRLVPTPSECILQYPNERNWTVEGLKFDYFYYRGYGELFFTLPIDTPRGAIGTIYYILSDGSVESKSITSYEYSEDVDPLSGMWTIKFDVTDEEIFEDKIASMRIVFNPFPCEGGEVKVSSMQIENNSISTSRNLKTKGIDKGTLSPESPSEICNIYNLQGILLIRDATTSDINNLPSGAYIINGKKFIKR